MKAHLIVALSIATALCAAARGQDSAPPSEAEPVALAGLGAPVVVERDARGIATIRGETLVDVVRGQGYVHGQDRCFQMDLMRRYAAGRLAELVGPMAADRDAAMRRLGLESVADAVVQGLPAGHRALLEAYAEGVNAGRASTPQPPPEYGFIPGGPTSWTSTDSILVVMSMCDTLHFGARFERRLGVMAEALAAPVYEFLTPDVTRLDSPLTTEDHDRQYTPLPIPGPDVVDLRTARRGASHDDLVDAAPLALGSNNWAVAGPRSGHGRAILANDPHLQITAPGIWYRVQLEWGGSFSSGASLPGHPGVVIGSNGAVAWGFTNSMLDFQDLVVIEVDPDDDGRYRTPDGWEAFDVREEAIDVGGGAPRSETVRVTRWGPVVDTDQHGRPLALQWTVLHAEMLNLRLLDMLETASIEEAMAVAAEWRGPAQNVLLADRQGRIGWTVSGYLPRRVGFTGRVPVSWADGDVGWEGESSRPSLIDPPDGVLYTANNRTTDVRTARSLGATWAAPYRADRIKEMLDERQGSVEADLFAMQLDTRVKALDPCRDLILELTEGAEDDRRRELRALAGAWDGTAEIDQRAVVVLEAVRDELHDALLGPLLEPCRRLDGSFRYWWMNAQEPILRLLEERPVHLLPPGRASWRELLDDVVQRAADRVRERYGRLDVPWGEVNVARIEHPLAQGAPNMARLLNMPPDPLPGHSEAVRVAAPAYGASLRMVVSPGRERDGLLHIPAGQSGHPMAPTYRTSHADWVRGRPVPLLPGPPAHRITLVP